MNSKKRKAIHNNTKFPINYKPCCSCLEKAVENGLTATGAADAEAAKRRATGLDQKARAEAKLLAAAKGSRL